MPVIPLSFAPKTLANSFKGKMIRIFVKNMICVSNKLLHMKVHIRNDQ